MWVSGEAPDSHRSLPSRIPAVVVISHLIPPYHILLIPDPRPSAHLPPAFTHPSTGSGICDSWITDTQWITCLTVVWCITPFDIAIFPKLFWVSGVAPDSTKIPIRVSAVLFCFQLYFLCFILSGCSDFGGQLGESRKIGTRMQSLTLRHQMERINS